MGKNTGKASSLIMMILGEALLIDPGRICDIDLTNPAGIFGISWTLLYVVPLVGFAYLGFYGYYCPKILKDKVSVALKPKEEDINLIFTDKSF
jgi:FHS family L-fucose permease-like MFS transporter